MKSLRPKNIVLLGASGFIGLHLQAFFKQSSYDNVVCLSSRDTDLENPVNVKKIQRLISENTILIMAAAITRERSDDIDTLNRNIAMVSTIAGAMEVSPPRHCIYLSSADIYGNPSDRLPITEKTECRPNTYYGVSKLVGEFIVGQTCRMMNSCLTILRFGGVYGKGNTHQHIVNNFLERAQKGETITIYGDGSDTRDYVFVDDLCHVIDRSVRDQIGGIFNVATGKSYSILEIANFVNESTARKVEIRFEARTQDPSHYRFVVSKLVDSFGGIAFKDLQEFIRESLKQPLGYELV